MAIFIYEVIYVLLVEFTIYKWHTNTTNCYGDDIEFLGGLALVAMSLFQLIIYLILIS